MKLLFLLFLISFDSKSSGYRFSPYDNSNFKREVRLDLAQKEI